MSGESAWPAGVDVSHWQASTPSLDGLSFLFARACYGTTRDLSYAQHASHARAAGLVVGAYCFGRGSESPAAQAAALLSVAPGADLLALDLESDAGHTPMSTAQAGTFTDAIHAAGRTVGLYHSESGYPDVGQDWRWVANWNREPVIPWDFWQWCGSPLDMDWYHGSEMDLWVLAGMGEVMKPITDETPAEVEVARGAMLYELDGRTEIRKVAADMPWRPSPFRCSNQRAIYIGTADTRRLALVSPFAIRAVPTAPQDCSAAIAADRATARIVWG
jgi:lysozyme